MNRTETLDRLKLVVLGFEQILKLQTANLSLPPTSECAQRLIVVIPVLRDIIDRENGGHHSDQHIQDAWDNTATFILDEEAKAEQDLRNHRNRN